MILKTLNGLRVFLRPSSLNTLNRCLSSTVPEVSLESTTPADDRIAFFRTVESDPTNHNEKHTARYYTVPPEVAKQLFINGTLPLVYEKQVKTFQETCIMVRNAALEVMDYLRAADYSGPAIRYVLFGRPGSGKTMTLAHILHYGFNSGYLIVHVPWVPKFTRHYKEISESSTKEGYVDHPLDAAAFLLHFKTQNGALLSKLNLTTSKEYVWSKRETTPQGAPLLELVEHGINRVKYACDCVAALLAEIKLLSTQNKCKTLVIIDGYNAFFHPITKVKRSTDKSIIPPSKFTVTDAFLDITKFNWRNGAVVVTVDQRATPEAENKSDFPIYQLGKDGFEHIDPFVPIQVDEYNEQELESCLAYYVERRWIQSEKVQTEQGKRELAFLSGMNPDKLMKLCAPL